MSDLLLQGVFPPIPTPFVDGHVAYDELAANIRKWSDTGLNGFVVLGSNGEGVYLCEEEKRKVIETAVAAAPPQMPIVAGCGCESTRETIRLTNDCAALGAHAALLINPHYYGGQMTAAALINHYVQVADRAEIPILLYNVPKFTHLPLSAAVVTELAQHPNIAGVKDSSGDVNLLGQIMRRAPRDFSVLVGTAGALFAGLALGCAGGILALANVAPEACVQIYRLVAENRYTEARELQLKMLPVNSAVTAVYGVSGLKAALDMLDYFGGDPRLPLLPASPEERTAIQKILNAAGLLPL